MQRLRASGTSIVGSISAARLKRKAVNSWTAVQDTFYSTKVIEFSGFEFVIVSSRLQIFGVLNVVTSIIVFHWAFPV